MVLQPWRLRSMQKGFPREAFFCALRWAQRGGKQN